MSWMFNPPPGWPVPQGFVPPQGWVPDPAWPPAPADWTYWVGAVPVAPEPPIEPPTAGIPAEDPYAVPPPGTASPATTWGAPAAPSAYPSGAYPSPPGYGGYGAPAYGAPAYGAPAYGAPAYGAPPARRGIGGGIIALIVVVVLLLIAGLVAGAIAIGRGVGDVVGPVFGTLTACNDAVSAIASDDTPPSSEQARSALPDLRDARGRAAEGVDSASLVSPTEVLRPIEEVIAGYEVFADLPANPTTWSPAEQSAADAAERQIEGGTNRLNNFCGIGSTPPDGGAQTVSR